MYTSNPHFNYTYEFIFVYLLFITPSTKCCVYLYKRYYFIQFCNLFIVFKKYKPFKMKAKPFLFYGIFLFCHIMLLLFSQIAKIQFFFKAMLFKKY